MLHAHILESLRFAERVCHDGATDAQHALSSAQLAPYSVLVFLKLCGARKDSRVCDMSLLIFFKSSSIRHNMASKCKAHTCPGRGQEEICTERWPLCPLWQRRWAYGMSHNESRDPTWLQFCRWKHTQKWLVWQKNNWQGNAWSAWRSSQQRSRQCATWICHVTHTWAYHACWCRHAWTKDKLKMPLFGSKISWTSCTQSKNHKELLCIIIHARLWASYYLLDRSAGSLLSSKISVSTGHSAVHPYASPDASSTCVHANPKRK